jgi:predicted DNA-binding transcriptional regulator YafY
VATSPVRQQRILQLIPKLPRKITVEQLAKKLVEDGIRVTTRTVRRDLEDLMALHPLVSDGNGRPQGWSWDRGAAPLLPPTLDPDTALAFKLLAHHAASALPPRTLAHLAPYLAQAQRILQNGPSQALRRWPDKIRVLAPGLPFLPAAIDDAVDGVVYRALFEERCFRARYRNAHRQTKEHIVHPLALVVRMPQRYLVCTVRAGQSPVQLALARIRSAELLDQACEVPAGFNLDDSLRRGELDVPLDPDPIQLRFRIRSEVGGFLFDTHFARDQSVVDTADGWLLVEGTVPNTRELRRWIFGFAGDIEILDPPQLREEIRAAARTLLERHDLGSQVTAGVTSAS